MSLLDSIHGVDVVRVDIANQLVLTWDRHDARFIIIYDSSGGLVDEYDTGVLNMNKRTAENKIDAMIQNGEYVKQLAQKIPTIVHIHKSESELTLTITAYATLEKRYGANTQLDAYVGRTRLTEIIRREFGMPEYQNSTLGFVRIVVERLPER